MRVRTEVENTRPTVHSDLLRQGARAFLALASMSPPPLAGGGLLSGAVI